MLIQVQVLMQALVLVIAKKCSAPLAQEPPITEPTDPPGVQAPVNWPKGRFSLLRAGDTCIQNDDSADGVKFHTGWRYQDTEDDRNANEWPKNSPGLGSSLKADGYKLHFCTKKGKEAKSVVTTRWPEGNYCIFQFGKQCPPRNTLWKKGSVTFDDENYNNDNFLYRTCPKGEYTDDITKYEFCCRDDGDVMTPILLPATVPFYMFRYTDRCQRVAFMDVTEEVVLWDNEDDNNKDAKEGFTPMEDGGGAGIRLHLCLYQPRASTGKRDADDDDCETAIL